MPSVNRKMRCLGAVLLSCSVAGCGVITGSDVRSIYDFGRQVVVPPRVTLQEAASSPYASLGVRVGGSPEVMIILATDSGGEQLWTSAARVAITTSHGRVIRTSGLEHDLGSLVAAEEKSGSDGTSLVRWIADIPDLKTYGLPVDCERRLAGDETITILGKPIQTRRIVEHCRAEARTFIWTFTNVYWADPENGFVWRSTQHINPKLDALELEVLRPPA